MKFRAYSSMLLAGAALAVTMVPLAGAAQTAFNPPKTAWGAPDIQGTWSNVTLTGLERPAQYGDRKVMTEQEVAVLEGRAIEGVYEGNKPTDPNAGADGGKDCDGPGGRDCGYNAGWKDETTKVMRVGGQPRTAFITSTANGRVPPRIAATNTAEQRARDAAEAQNAAGEGPVPPAPTGPTGPGEVSRAGATTPLGTADDEADRAT